MYVHIRPGELFANSCVWYYKWALGCKLYPDLLIRVNNGRINLLDSQKNITYFIRRKCEDGMGMDTVIDGAYQTHEI
jgi:hypothetical protein